MSTKINSKKVPSRKDMTPEKYKALSPAMKRAYDKKCKAEFKAWDERVIATRMKEHEQLALSLIEIVAKDRYIESMIIKNFLDRTNQCLMDRDEADRDFARKYPKLAKQLKSIQG